MRLLRCMPMCCIPMQVVQVVPTHLEKRIDHLPKGVLNKVRSTGRVSTVDSQPWIGRHSNEAFQVFNSLDSACHKKALVLQHAHYTISSVA